MGVEIEFFDGGGLVDELEVELGEKLLEFDHRRGLTEEAFLAQMIVEEMNADLNRIGDELLLLARGTVFDQVESNDGQELFAVQSRVDQRHFTGEVLADVLVEGVLLDQILTEHLFADGIFLRGDLVDLRRELITSQRSVHFTLVTNVFQLARLLLEIADRQSVRSTLKSIQSERDECRGEGRWRSFTFSDWCRPLLVCVGPSRSSLSDRSSFDEFGSKPTTTTIGGGVKGGGGTNLFFSGEVDQFLHLFERFSSFHVDEFVNFDQIVDGLVENGHLRGVRFIAAIVPSDFALTEFFEGFGHVLVAALRQLNKHCLRRTTNNEETRVLTKSFSFFHKSANVLHESRMYRTRL